MDTFMDKLAQKLTAQEMIKANSAADAAELSRAKEQNAEYEAVLQKIKADSEKNAANAARIEQNAAKVEQNAVKAEQNAARIEQNAVKVEELLAAGIAKIEEIQAGSQNTEELNALLAELKQVQAEQFEQLTDHVHKENVKVYRNVQAVIIEEAAKQNEISGKSCSAVSAKVNALLGVSIVALLLSAAGVVFQILAYLHII